MTGTLRVRAGVTVGSRMRWLALLAVGWALGGCDLGHRAQGVVVDGGLDGGGDADTDVDSDTDSDSDSDDTDWRYEDAGDFWDDGEVEIEDECGNDCRYLYEVRRAQGGGSWYGTGTYQFEISPGASGQVIANDIGSARYMIWWDWPDYALQRQRLLARYVLDDTSHDLISGEITHYSRYGGLEQTRFYSLAYDDAADELTYTVKQGSRHWSRTLSSPEAPVVMFAYRDFPAAPFGSHSALCAFLLAERYDWEAGGVQQIPIFAPEVERVELVEVESGDDDDTLIVHYPVETAQPLWVDDDDDSLTRNLNDVEYRYEHGIPTWIGVRYPYQLQVINGPSFELNLSEAGETTEQTGPVPFGGYTTSELVVDTGALDLAAAVDDPSFAGPHPAVVMIPGWSHQTRAGEVGPVDLYGQLGDWLAAAGYLVARVDARGTGGSDGAAEEALVSELVADAVATLDAVAALTEADGDQVFLLTSGIGAHIAALAAQDSGADVAGLILLAPSGQDYATNGGNLHEHYLLSGEFDSGYAYNEGLKIFDLMADINGDSYEGDAFRGHEVDAWQSLFGLDLVDSPVALPPTLIAIGTEDHLIPVSEATDLGAALSGAGTTVTVEELSGLTHAFTVGTAAELWPERSGVEAVDTTAASAILGWLDLQTGGE